MRDPPFIEVINHPQAGIYIQPALPEDVTTDAQAE
jgi:hypothetical protein